MDFKRKKKRGESQKVRRYWFSEEGYRVIWRSEVWGVQVPPRFQACVRTIIPNYGGEDKTFEMWDFVTPRLYKTLKAAQEDCERHKRLWLKACEATGIRGLVEIFGKLPSGIPVWVRKKLPRKVYEILTRPRTVKYHEDDECEPDRDDLTRTSECSACVTEVTPADHAPDPTPALPATVEDGPKKLTTRRSGSKTTDAESSAKPAEEPAEAPKKRATKRTTKRSPTTTKTRKPTTRSSKSAKKPAANSPKKKSKRSKS